MILAGKTSRKIIITKRIAELKNVIEVNTQRLRSEALDRLKQLFNLASEDYLGAYNAGLKAILIDRKGMYKSKQCPKISTLTALISLLRHE